jgi:hypothetical protein
MPVRMRTLFAAKVVAVVAALACAVFAVNSFTGAVYPFLISPGSSFTGFARCFGAWWAVVLLSSAFLFFLLLGVQGIAIHLLPHGLFLRWSSIIQCALFFALLSLYFLMPPLATPQALAAPANQWWYRIIPSYWFLGLFQVMKGSANPAFEPLARRALSGVAAVTLFAAVTYVLAYARQMRRTVEQSGITPARRNTAMPWAGTLARLFCRRPVEQAIFAFMARTIARSRQHRLMLALYAGLGLAYVFSDAAYVLYHSRPNSRYARMAWEQTEIGIPLILIFFLIVGLRVSFSIPMELRANWLFRLTDPFAFGAYLGAARKVLLAFVLGPVVAISALGYSLLWPWWRALGHAGFLAGFGLLLIEVALTRFDKVPFTCAYVPGKANLKVKFGIYWGLLLTISGFVTQIERAALESRSGYAKLMFFTLLAWFWAYRRARGARATISAVSFDEPADTEVLVLGLAGRN